MCNKGYNRYLTNNYTLNERFICQYFEHDPKLAIQRQGNISVVATKAGVRRIETGLKACAT